MPEAGFVIDGNTYAFPTRFRLGDWVLIRDVTGLESGEFATRIDDVRERVNAGEEIPTGESSLLTMVGMVAVAVWQANPRWTRDRVRQYVESLDIATFEMVRGDDAVPPTGVPASPSSGTSSEPTSTAEPFVEPARSWE